MELYSVENGLSKCKQLRIAVAKDPGGKRTTANIRNDFHRIDIESQLVPPQPSTCFPRSTGHQLRQCVFSTLEQRSLSDGIMDLSANSSLEIPTQVAKGTKVCEVSRRKGLTLMLRVNSCICSTSAGRYCSLFTDTSSSYRFFRPLI